MNGPVPDSDMQRNVSDKGGAQRRVHRALLFLARSPAAWVCRRIATVSGLAVLASASAIGLYCGAIAYLGNIHVVKDGQLYRSAQLSRNQFDQVIKEYGIKSILNLRGNGSGQLWYKDEIAVSHALNVKHYDYGIWASGIASSKQIDDILTLVREAPKPLLVHCQGGADRSGLVSALYVAEIEGRPVEEASWQLSLIYGHFPYLTSKTGAMDTSFWAYVRAHPPHRLARASNRPGNVSLP